MSAMQAFYTELTAEPRQSYFASLVSLTKARLGQIATLTLGWWSW